MTRHPEVRAPHASLRSLRKLGCVRASKDERPQLAARYGPSPFEALASLEHLRVTVKRAVLAEASTHSKKRACTRRANRTYAATRITTRSAARFARTRWQHAGYTSSGNALMPRAQ